MSEGQGRQKPLAKMLGVGVPQIGHLVAHAGILFKGVGFVALVDVMLAGAGQL